MSFKKSRRAVIINDIKSDIISQAIFILKPSATDKIPADERTGIASEAQSIIDSYARALERSETKKKRWF